MIRQLEVKDTKDFCNLIVNMYSNLENLEWFTPMPYDYDNVKGMIENPRFYIIGYFENDTLCGVGSLDYKCGKLIGKIDFPDNCNTDKLVEVGFHIVHTKYRGNGIMKKMLNYLLEKIENDGFEWVFGKVNKDNLASYNSLLKCGFYDFNRYVKPVKIKDFKELSSADFFCKKGKENADKTLAKYSGSDENLFADYRIVMKKII